MGLESWDEGWGVSPLSSLNVHGVQCPTVWFSARRQKDRVDVMLSPSQHPWRTESHLEWYHVSRWQSLQTLASFKSPNTHVVGKTNKPALEWNQPYLLSDEREAGEGKRLSLSLWRAPGLKKRKLVEWTFEEGECDFGQKEPVKREHFLILRAERDGKKAIWWLLRMEKKELPPFNSFHGSVFNGPL